MTLASLSDATISRTQHMKMGSIHEQLL